MAGKEEAAADRKWMLRPCNAAKSTEDSVAGDHCPVMRFPSKRKAAAGSSYKDGEKLSEGCIDLSATAGQEQPGSYDPFVSGRRESAIDKMLGEAKLSAVLAKKSADASMAPPAAEEAASASGGNKGKFRLPADEIKLILALKRDDLPNIDYLDDLAELYTPEEIAERRRLHQKDLELFKKIDDDFEVYQKEVRDSIEKYGYFEVDYDYLEERKKINAWTKQQWAKIKEVNVKYCAADADQATQGYIEYVDSDDDGSEYDEDSESDDED